MQKPDDTVTNYVKISCAHVPAPPRDTEIDMVLFEQEGILQYSYSRPNRPGEAAFAIAYRDDPACERRPALRRLIHDALSVIVD